MAELATLPKREWCSSDECVEMLEKLLASAKRGEIVALAYVAARRTEDFESGATKVNDCFAMAGYLFSMGMRLMGFEDTRKLRLT